MKEIRSHIFSLLYNGNTSNSDIISTIRESHITDNLTDAEILDLIAEIEPEVMKQYDIDNEEKGIL